MVEWAPDSLALVEKLLYTHDIKDAWSDTEFPQFMQSDDPSQNVYAAFAGSNSLGTKTGSSGDVIIKNVSSKKILINSVSVDGEKAGKPFTLKPNEIKLISVDTNEAHNGVISVNYSKSLKLGKEQIKDFRYSVKDDYSGVISDCQLNEKTETALNNAFAFIWHICNTAIRLLKTALSNLFSK